MQTTQPAIFDPNAPPIEIIDSSIISTWRSCKQKFFLSHIQKFKSLGESIHLIAGGAFAAGLEGARIHQFTKSIGVQAPIDDLLHAAMAKFSPAWGEFDTGEEDTKNFHNTFHALEQYLVEYPPFTDAVQPLIKPDGSPAVEFTFAIPLPVNNPKGSPYVFCGRFDLLGYYYDLMVLQDEKTTSALGPYWLNSWSMRGQFMGYMWACRQLGYPVDQVIVRGIAIQKTQFQFASVPVPFTNTMIERWYQELLNTLHEINQYYEAGVWPYNFADACTAYGGCTFKDLCSSDNIEPWLSNYEHNNWTPLSAEGP